MVKKHIKLELTKEIFELLKQKGISESEYSKVLSTAYTLANNLNKNK